MQTQANTYKKVVFFDTNGIKLTLLYSLLFQLNEIY